MKLRKQPHATRFLFQITLLTAAVVSLALSCGKKDSVLSESDGTIQLKGTTAFGSQCPYGMTIDPQPVKMTAWDCPSNNGTIELTKPPQALFFQADCKKKLLTIRGEDQRIDSVWAVMPDGSFFISLDVGQVRMIYDGSGECTAAVTADLFGRLVCNDRDKVDIELDTVWYPGGRPSNAPLPTTSPSPGPSAIPSPLPTTTAATGGQRQCNLPQSCFLQARTLIHQCQ